MFDTLDRSMRNPRSRWTAALSFTLQAAGVCVLLLIPLLYTEALPVVRADAALPPPPRRAEFDNQRVTEIVSARHETPSEVRDGHVMLPTRIPDRIDRTVDPVEPQTGSTMPGAIPNGVGAGDDRLRALTALLPPEPPRPTVATPNVAPRTLRLSHLDAGMLIKRVEPSYPSRARLTRTQGIVRLHAVVDRRGEVAELSVISGHPFLVAAAIDAVRQWRYRPYMLNGEPVPVETEITVNFILGQ